MNIEFEHRQSAHCENGAVSNLLNFHGLTLSEPMVFGIGSGLFLCHLPFVKLNGIPVTTYRTLPGQIFRRFAKRTGIQVHTQKFRSEEKAMEELDRCLEKGLPVGMLTSVFYLPYLPKAFRFHFNAHNIVAFGKKNGNYLISDSVMDYTTEISPEDLIRARFAKGTAPPKGRMYYPLAVPTDIDLKQPIIKGIKNTAYDMSRIPVPLFGHKAGHFLAKRIRKWPEKLGKRKASQFAGHLIRMQEEIGTGGAGFRFIFAAFLQEAAPIMGDDWLKEKSTEMTAIGDRWRDLAYIAGRLCKGRNNEDETYDAIADIMIECAEREYVLFDELYKKYK